MAGCGSNNDDTHNRPQEFADLISAAMGAQGGHIPLEDDTTFRLRPSAGDYLLWVRCANPLCNPPEFAVADFWNFVKAIGC